MATASYLHATRLAPDSHVLRASAAFVVPQSDHASVRVPPASQGGVPSGVGVPSFSPSVVPSTACVPPASTGVVPSNECVPPNALGVLPSGVNLLRFGDFSSLSAEDIPLAADFLATFLRNRPRLHLSDQLMPQPNLDFLFDISLISIISTTRVVDFFPSALPEREPLHLQRWEFSVQSPSKPVFPQVSPHASAEAALPALATLAPASHPSFVGPRPTT